MLPERLQRPEIEDLVIPLEALVAQLVQPVREGKYNLLIGDDFSGRIPYWTISDWIQLAYRQYGFTRPSCFTFDIKNPLCNLEEKLAEFRDRGRALVITEAVFKGMTIWEYTGRLGNLSIPFDVATLLVTHPVTHYSTGATPMVRPPTMLMAGEQGVIMEIDDRYDLLGLKWNEAKACFEDDLSPNGRESLKKTTDDIEVLVDNLAQKYLL